MVWPHPSSPCNLYPYRTPVQQQETMRNNTKIKKLLEDNDLNFTMEHEEIQLMVIDKTTKSSYLANGTNITEVLNDAIKWSNAFKKQSKPAV